MLVSAQAGKSIVSLPVCSNMAGEEGIAEIRLGCASVKRRLEIVGLHRVYVPGKLHGKSEGDLDRLYVADIENPYSVCFSPVSLS